MNAHTTRVPTQRPGLRTPQVISARSRTARLRVDARIDTEAATRVKGSIEHVYRFVSDPQNMQNWQRAITDTRILSGSGPDLRSKWQFCQSVGNMKVDVVYQIVDLQPNKRIQFASSSDLYKGLDQAVFMPDPMDPSFTIVRWISSIELHLWKRPLRPLLVGIFNDITEQNLKQLGALLNSKDSPLKSTWVNSKNSSSKQRSSGNPFANFFSGRRTSNETDSASQKIELDALGYYAVLGLDAKSHHTVKAQDVKSAFRRAAMTMHPDKFSMDEELMADEARRTAMEENYKKVTRAYDVLKDPEQKKLYDEGRLLEGKKTTA